MSIAMGLRSFKCAAFFLVLLAVCTANAQRASIGIIPLENKAGINPVTVDVITDMLMTAFTKSQKFEVLERDSIDRVLDEQNFAASGAVSEESGAQMGKLQGADFMVLGAVTEAGASAKTTGAYGVLTTQSSVTLAIDIRFVDSTTGRARFAETFRETRGGVDFTTDSTGTVSFSEGPGGDMARELVDNIAGKVLVSVYPPKIVQADPEAGTVILNYGDQLMRPGDVWTVYSQGEELKDPDTGESLGSSEKKVGKIVITESGGKTSHGEIQEGTASVGDLCRRDAPKPRPSEGRRVKVDPF